MATSLELKPESLDAYRATAQLRWEEEQQELTRREERAWALARQAVALLRKQFGATRIVVFGSLVYQDMFTLWSDVDIAAWDIQPRDTLRAIGAVFDLDTDIQVILVDVNTASTELLYGIGREGIEL